MKLKLLGGAALVGLFVASGACAQPADSGWYGAIDLGAHWLNRLDTTSSLPESDGSAYKFRFSENTDWVGFARVGYKINPHVRIELEGG